MRTKLLFFALGLVCRGLRAYRTTDGDLVVGAANNSSRVNRERL